MGKANNNTVLFHSCTATGQFVCGKRYESKRITRHNLTFLSSRPSLISKVESNPCNRYVKASLRN